MTDDGKATLSDIKDVIWRSGLTRCESRHCEGCEFDIKSPEAEEFGNVNICILLNEIYRAKPGGDFK